MILGLGGLARTHTHTRACSPLRTFLSLHLQWELVFAENKLVLLMVGNVVAVLTFSLTAFNRRRNTFRALTLGAVEVVTQICRPHDL